jgi:hypothetical protein
VYDDRGEHRVVVGAHDRPVAHAGVHPDRGQVRDPEAVQDAISRSVVRTQVLCVEPGLDRVPGDRRRSRLGGQRLALGHQQLQRHQVQPGDLGDRVLHLQPGVDLQEVEAPVPVEHELDGARAHRWSGSCAIDSPPTRCSCGGGTTRPRTRPLPIDELLDAALG